MIGKKAKNPSSLVYWNDLENDEELKTCGWAARGLWSCKLLPIAARSVEHGVVQLGEHPCRWDGDLPTLLAIESGAGAPDVVTVVAANFLSMLTELVRSGAAAVDDRGRITNRRMVREAKVSAERSRAGRQGALVTNTSRQTGRQNSGKRAGKGGGKQVGNDPGKEVGKPVGKTAVPENALSTDSTSTIRNEPQPDVRQNPGKAVGNDLGTDPGKQAGKSPASSYFSPNGDSLRVEPLQGSTPEEVQTPSPVAARGSAGGAPHTTPIVGRPPIADRMAALLAERRKEAGAS